MSTMTPQRMLQAATVRMLRTAPFYATMLMNLKVIWDSEDPKVPTAATDGLHLYMNTDFFTTLSDKARSDLLKHEVLHNVLMHCSTSRFDRRVYTQATRLNIAQDHVINLMIKDEGGLLPNWHCDEQFRGMTAEQVYRALPDDLDDGKGGSGGVGGCAGNDVIPTSAAADAATAAKISKDIAQAINVAKAMGKLPGKGVQDLVFDILNPKVPWQTHVADWMCSPSKDDYSMSRPNRRFLHSGLRLPGMYSPTGSMRQLAVVLDISGSTTPQDRALWLNEVFHAAQDVRPTEVHIALVDTEVVETLTLVPPIEESDLVFKTRHGGGTDMVAGLQWALELGPEVEGVIVMTDGYTPFGDGDMGLRVLWLLTDSSDRIVPPYGATVRITSD